MSDEIKTGIVYIFTNEAMPGYIKIGLTQQETVESRLRQLDNTSVPLPFECYYSAFVPDCSKLERTLHFVFGEKRARLRREFFRTDPDLVKAIIDLVAVQSGAPTSLGGALDITDASLTQVEIEAVEEIKRIRAQRRTLGALGLKPGTVLRFSKDKEITCVVQDERNVSFRGQIQSLSRAALTVVQEMGYTWTAVSGTDYWMLENVRLSELDRQPDSYSLENQPSI